MNNTSTKNINLLRSLILSQVVIVNFIHKKKEGDKLFTKRDRLNIVNQTNNSESYHQVVFRNK